MAPVRYVFFPKALAELIAVAGARDFLAETDICPSRGEENGPLLTHVTNERERARERSNRACTVRSLLIERVFALGGAPARSSTISFCSDTFKPFRVQIPFRVVHLICSSSKFLSLDASIQFLLLFGFSHGTFAMRYYLLIILPFFQISVVG